MFFFLSKGLRVCQTIHMDQTTNVKMYGWRSKVLVEHWVYIRLDKSDTRIFCGYMRFEQRKG